MKQSVTGLITLMLSALLLSGCASMDKEDAGMLAGGAGGAAVGYTLSDGDALGTAVGAIGGAFLGKTLASDDDK